MSALGTAWHVLAVIRDIAGDLSLAFLALSAWWVIRAGSKAGRRKEAARADGDRFEAELAALLQNMAGDGR